MFKILDFSGYKIEVHDNGDIFRVERTFYNPTGKKYFLPRIKLTATDNGFGYKWIGMYIDGKAKRDYIHRLVAQAFIPNPNNLPEVNHKNGIRSDNRLENLEWISRIDNVRDYIIKGRQTKPPKKPVLQFDKEGRFIKRHDCLLDAAIMYNTTDENIRHVVLGNTNLAIGYHWIYENVYDKNIHTQEYIREKVRNKQKRTVYKYSLNLEFLKEFDSCSAASKEFQELGCNKIIAISRISSCCLGRRKSAYGYIYSYVKF